MDTAWLIYWYLVIGNLGWIVFVFAVLEAIAIVAYGVFTFSNKDPSICSYDFQVREATVLRDNYPLIKRCLKINTAITLFVSIIASLYPSKTDLAYIFGGAALVSVASTEEAQKLPDNVLRAVNVFLEGVAEEEPSQ